MNCSFVCRTTVAAAHQRSPRPRTFVRQSTLDEIVYRRQQSSESPSPRRVASASIASLLEAPQRVWSAAQRRLVSRSSDASSPPLAAGSYAVSPSRLGFVALAAALGAKRRMLGRLRRRHAYEDVVFPIRRPQRGDGRVTPHQSTSCPPQGFIV